MAKKPPKKQERKIAQLAQALKISTVQVWRLAQRGMPLDADGARAWRAANVKTKTGKVADEVARLKSAQADLAELEAAERRDEVIDVEEVRYVFGAAMTAMTTQMEGLPGRVSTELAALNDPAVILHRLKDEIRRIRAAVAEEFCRLAVLASIRASGPTS
jgi:phage terminase Nu1 subunit (DNA packaging protein)